MPSKQHALKGQKLIQAARSARAEAHTSSTRSKQHAQQGQKSIQAARSNKQHALKGQKLLAQGSALGMMTVSKAPCKGKSFVNCLILLKLLPLQGDKFAPITTQGAALG